MERRRLPRTCARCSSAPTGRATRGPWSTSSATTVDAHGDAAAIDDGAVVPDLPRAGRRGRTRCAAGSRAAGVGAGDRVGVRIAVRHRRALRRDPGRPGRRRGLRPGRRRRPGRAGPAGLRRGRRRAPSLGDGPAIDAARRRPRRRRAAAARPRRRRLDHLHLRLHRHAQGRRGHATARAAAFVDAEAGCSCRTSRSGPGDRVLAGLSVAFDASCEEMWLAWRARRLPGARRRASLVRSGMDLGPGWSASDITVVSTVPTLAALWPAEALDERPAADLRRRGLPARAGRSGWPSTGREVWNTYGPTEATVVACAAPLTGDGPVRIGLPLDGWDLAVVDAAGEPVAEGESRRADHRRRRPGPLPRPGEGRREVRAAADARLGARLPQRRPGPRRRRGAGLPRPRRRPGQARRPADRAGRGRRGAAGAARASPARPRRCARTAAGNQLLVGYVVARRRRRARPRPPCARLRADAARRAGAAAGAGRRRCRRATSGKVDRDALPWPLPSGAADGGRRRAAAPAPTAWLAEQWTGGARASPVAGPRRRLLRPRRRQPRRRPAGRRGCATRYPGGHRRRHLRAPDAAATLAAALDELGAPRRRAEPRRSRPTPRRDPGRSRPLLAVPLLTAGRAALAGLARGAGATLAAPLGGCAWAADACPWWWSLLGWLLLVSPPGRMAIAAVGARLLLRGVGPGSYPRGGAVHLRLWLAERLADAAGATNLAGAPWITVLRAGARRARSAGTSTCTRCRRSPACSSSAGAAAVEPEVDLVRHWLDGDVLHVGADPGRRRRHASARAARCCPGARVGQRRRGRAGLGGRRRGARRAAAGPGRPPRGRRAARAAWPRPARRRARRAGWRPTALTAVAARRCCPLVAALAGAARGRLGVRGAATAADAAARRAAAGCRSAAAVAGSAVLRAARRWSACGCSASGCARATTRCAAGSAGRSGPPSG